MQALPCTVDSLLPLFLPGDGDGAGAGAWIDPSSGFWGAKGNPLNGGSNAPFQGGKGSTWEGGVREPAILWAPGRIAPGSLSMEIVNMMDFFPTFIELAGGKVWRHRLPHSLLGFLSHAFVAFGLCPLFLPLPSLFRCKCLSLSLAGSELTGVRWRQLGPSPQLL